MSFKHPSRLHKGLRATPLVCAYPFGFFPMCPFFRKKEEAGNCYPFRYQPRLHKEYRPLPRNRASPPFIFFWTEGPDALRAKKRNRNCYPFRYQSRLHKEYRPASRSCVPLPSFFFTRTPLLFTLRRQKETGIGILSDIDPGFTKSFAPGRPGACKPLYFY